MKWHLSFYWLLWVVPAFFIVPTCAKASGFVVEVALNHIDVTVGFSGASIQVFGDRRDKDAEVAIVVMGPKKDITIWQKARVMGTWVNRYFVKFRDMPMYYNYALSAKNVDDAMQTLMSDNVIGNDSLFLRPDLDGAEGKKTALFKDALLRKKIASGVFFEDSVPLTFLNDNFFRADFSIPPSAPTGEYKIYSFLIKNGHVVEHDEDVLKVEQVGLNAFISEASRSHSVIYALICIGIGLFSGWIVSVLRVVF